MVHWTEDLTQGSWSDTPPGAADPSQEKGRRGSGGGCCGLRGAAPDANRVTPRLPLTLAAPARSEAAFVYAKLRSAFLLASFASLELVSVSSLSLTLPHLTSLP